MQRELKQKKENTGKGTSPSRCIQCATQVVLGPKATAMLVHARPFPPFSPRAFSGPGFRAGPCPSRRDFSSFSRGQSPAHIVCLRLSYSGHLYDGWEGGREEAREGREGGREGRWITLPHSSHDALFLTPRKDLILSSTVTYASFRSLPPSLPPSHPPTHPADPRLQPAARCSLWLRA
jgi:hypothetical protein